MDKISETRRRIDEVDEQLVKLLRERMKLVRTIGEEKARQGIAVENLAREAEVLRRVTEGVPECEKHSIYELFKCIFSVSKGVQSSLSKRRFCLIGKSLPYSLSAEIHAELGLDYAIVELANSDELRAFMERNEYDGFNVTIPYKEEIIPYLDYVSDEARAIGAVNTVIKTDKGLAGYNTDIMGIKYAVESAGISVKDKKVAVLGSGGTAKTILYYLGQAGAAEIVKVGRTSAVNYENVYDHKDIEVIFNATPVGTYPDNYSSPVDVGRFPALSGVFDAVYNPLTTCLVANARKIGITAECGLGMLVEQARLAAQLFTNTQIDDCVTKDVLDKIKAKRRNIVLIGMPGVGKSTFGKMLSSISGRQFVDTDAEIERETGTDCANYIINHGEFDFREVEKRIIERVAKQQGVIIATGGGAVLDSENVAKLKQNGVVVYLTRPIEDLSSSNRPLSVDIPKLFREREYFYLSAADITIELSKFVF